MLHLILHVLIPGICAAILALYVPVLRLSVLPAQRGVWRLLSIWAWLLVGMVVDLDHLLANPIYDPERCSIGFHPLHSAVATVFYVIGLVVAWPRAQNPGWCRFALVLTGVILHLILDALDCIF